MGCSPPCGWSEVVPVLGTNGIFRLLLLSDRPEPVTASMVPIPAADRIFRLLPDQPEPVPAYQFFQFLLLPDQPEPVPAPQIFQFLLLLPDRPEPVPASQIFLFLLLPDQPEPVTALPVIPIPRGTPRIPPLTSVD